MGGASQFCMTPSAATSTPTASTYRGWPGRQGPAPLMKGYFHEPRGVFAVGFYFVDNLMRVLKFKFRMTIGSYFWDLLQEVLQQILESLGIPGKRNRKEP